MVVYETDDADLAGTAIEALRNAHIDCYTTGGRLSEGPSDPMVCIHIRNNSDYGKANEILIRHGAVVDRPIRLPSGPKAWAGLVMGSVLFIWLIAWLMSK